MVFVRRGKIFGLISSESERKFSLSFIYRIVQLDCQIFEDQKRRKFRDDSLPSANLIYSLPVKQVIDMLKGALGASNPSVRQSAVTLIGTLSLYIGKTLRTFFDDEKPQLVALIDEELKKLEGTSPPAPVRGRAAASGGGGEDEEDGAAGGGEVAAEVNPEDLIPRTDISDQITSTLLEKMSDKNWKVSRFTHGLQIRMYLKKKVHRWDRAKY